MRRPSETITPRPFVLGGFEEPITEPLTWVDRVIFGCAIVLSLGALAGTIYVIAWLLG